MAITGSTVAATQSLEEFRLEFNKIVSDVTQLQDNPTYGTSLIFEGTTDDAFETTFTVSDPSADRTVTIPDADGTILLTGAAAFSVADGGTIGSATSAEAMTIASDGVVTFSDPPVLTEIDSGSTITLDATTDIVLDAGGADIFLKDDGTQFGNLVNNGGELRITSSSSNTTALSFSGANITAAGTFTGGGLMTTGGNIVIPDAGNIGSASDTDAIAISSGGAVTFSQTPIFSSDITLTDDLYLDSDASVIHLGDNGDVTLTHVHDTGVLINSSMQFQFGDAGTYIHQSADGVLDLVSDTELELNATTIDINGNVEISGTQAQVGVATFTARDVHSGGITIADAGQIGSASDLDAIAISSAGLVTFSQEVQAEGGVQLSDNDKLMVGTGDDMQLYHDASNSYITNAVGALKIATETSGIAVTIGHGTSEVTIGDNLTVTGNLTVSGTQTVVDTVTMNAANAIILEGATADAHETTLTLVDPTADRTITFPNETGTVHTSGGTTTHTAILLPDAGTVGSASSTSAITIASTGIVTFVDDILIKDAGTIGSASDPNAIGISSGGVVSVTATTASSSVTTGALTVAGGMSTQADLYVGDLISAAGDIYLAGTSKELRFYEGANYVGFEAPSLSGDQIWVLPDADGGDGEALVTDSSGNLSFASNNIGNATTFTATANNSTNETVYPIFVDGATGEQGAETDTGLTYNPSTGLVSTAGVTTTGDINVGGDLTVTGTTTLNGNLVLGDAAADTLTIGATLQGASPLTFEGATADGHETTFAITDPTADRTITFPNETGTVHTSGGTTTHTAIVIADAGTIGSASDTDTISISSGGIVEITKDQDIDHDIGRTTIGTFASDYAVFSHIDRSAASSYALAQAAVGNTLINAVSGQSVSMRIANTDQAVWTSGVQTIHSTAAAPLIRRGEDVYLVLDQTAAAGTDAGDNIILDRTAGAGTDAGDDIIGEDQVFLHSGMQRNVINIKGSDGKIKNSVAGFAPGAI